MNEQIARALQEINRIRLVQALTEAELSGQFDKLQELLEEQPDGDS